MSVIYEATTENLVSLIENADVHRIQIDSKKPPSEKFTEFLIELGFLVQVIPAPDFAEKDQKFLTILTR